jgi:hypothetical protein
MIMSTTFILYKGRGKIKYFCFLPLLFLIHNLEDKFLSFMFLNIFSKLLKHIFCPLIIFLTDLAFSIKQHGKDEIFNTHFRYSDCKFLHWSYCSEKVFGKLKSFVLCHSAL